MAEKRGFCWSRVVAFGGVALVGSAVYALWQEQVYRGHVGQAPVAADDVQRPAHPVATTTVTLKQPQMQTKTVTLRTEQDTPMIGRGGAAAAAKVGGTTPARSPRTETAQQHPAATVALATGGQTGVMANIAAAPVGVEGDAAEEMLPTLPQRAEVASVMGGARDSVQHCYETTMVPGRVELLLTVDGESGSVLRADVDAEARVADCVERAAADLTFPRFAKPQARVKYAYVFR